LSVGLGTWLALGALGPGEATRRGNAPGATKDTEPIRPDPRRLTPR